MTESIHLETSSAQRAMRARVAALAGALSTREARGSADGADVFLRHFVEQTKGTFELDTVLTSVLAEANASCGVERAFVALLNDEGQYTHTVSWPPSELNGLFAHSRTVLEYVRGRREPLWSHNLQADERLAASQSVDRLGLITVGALPLMTNEEPLGVLYVEREGERPFEAAQQSRLGVLAACAEHALGHAREFAGMGAKLKKYQVINDVSLAITATIQLEELLGLILTHSLALSGGDQGYVLLGGASEELRCLASMNRAGQKLTEVQISHSITRRVIAENRSVCILDTSQDETSQSASVMALDLRSVMCVPLVANQQLLGVLYISSNAITKTFTAQDQSLLESIATQAALTIRNAQLLEAQKAQIAQLEEALEAYRRAELAASTDMLTGLHNRRYFQERATEAIALCQRQGAPFSLLLLDVDHFKQFNDTYGHAVGDEVLKAMGKVLPASVRAYDVPARFGGEEFVVLCPETDGAGAKQVAERVREAVMAVKLSDAEGKPVRQLTCSIGIAGWTPADTDIATVMERADTALYACKANGRNQSLLWEPQMPSPEELKRREQAARAQA